MRRSTRFVLPFLTLVAAGCGGCQKKSAPASSSASATAKPTGEKVVTLIATTELRGTPEPCGCQSDPVGDVARIADLVTEARKANEGKGGAVLVDAGGLRYKAERIPPEQQAQAELKANFLEKAWSDQGAVMALGDEDLVMGASHVPPGKRLASNVTGMPFAAPTVRDVGGVKVGFFAVLDPTKESLHTAGLQATDPTAAATTAIDKLRAEGAQVIVALAHLSRPQARKLARNVPGLSIVVAGDEAGDDGGEPEQVGDTIVVQPADQGQKAARVELHLVGNQLSTKLFAGAEEREAQLKKLDKRIDSITDLLERLKADPAADIAFVDTKETERTRLRAERDKLRAASPTPPPGSYAVAQLIPIRRKIPRDTTLASEMKQLDAKVGEANRSAAENTPPPPAAAGDPHYVGIEECEDCHPKAVEFWKTTVHAKGWEELVAVNKQWSYDCISCHVTGYGKPGGSSMAHVKGLESVQCEVCHGPASEHSDTPKKIKLRNPTEADCKDCHTPEHSDTFQYEAYLRDILGPGHGEKRRATLGPGPTGHDLRHGAIERAKQM